MVSRASDSIDGRVSQAQDEEKLPLFAVYTRAVCIHLDFVHRP
jgi:hypothetical protein